MQMPDKTNLEFESICKQVVHIHAEWKMYRCLFGDNVDHFDLYNEIDQNFFRQLIICF